MKRIYVKSHLASKQKKRKLESDKQKVLGLIDEAKSELKKEVDKHLADMKKAMGITFHEFYQQERQKEEEILKNMLTNPEVRKAYSEYSQIPIETLNQMNIPGTVSIPPSVFTDFNSDPEAIARAEYEKNFGLRKINPGR